MASISKTPQSWYSYQAATVDWDGVFLGASASDSAYLHTIAQQAGSGRTNYILRLRAFDFSAIPAGAAILGVQIDLYGHASGSQVYETIAQLANANTQATADQIGVNKARGSSATWPTSDGLIASFGGPSDTWGATLTRAVIQSTNFAFDLGVAATVNLDCYVNLVQITVTYAVASTGTIAITESGDTAALVGKAKVAASLVATESPDLVTLAARGFVSAALLVLEAADTASAAARGTVSAGFTVTELADLVNVAARQLIPIYPGRNATITEKGAPTAILLEKGGTIGTLVERGASSAEI